MSRPTATAWAISIREDVRKVAAHPCIYGSEAGCKRCATCRARADLAQLETARAPVSEAA